MNGFDLVVVLAVALVAIGGWRLGFLRRISGWLGAALGLGLALVLLPHVVGWLHVSSDVALFAVGAALLVLGASLGQALGGVIGSRLRSGVDGTAVRRLDALGGAALGAVGVVVLLWLVVPVMAETEGWPSASARGSTVAAWVSDYLPPPPPQVAELERQLAGGTLPQMFTGLRPAPELAPPPAQSTVTQAQLDAVASSVVKVEGPACGRLQSGSGFFVEDGIVATNAHVVAGEEAIEVVTPSGERGAAQLIAFDPAVDLALLRTDLSGPPIELASASVGDSGLVLGFPGGGPFEPSTFEVGQRVRATGYDIYDREPVQRELLVLASDLEPGDSGSAVFRDDGRVIGVAVAIAPDRAGVAYALSSRELIDFMDRSTRASVSAGSCLR